MAMDLESIEIICGGHLFTCLFGLFEMKLNLELQLAYNNVNALTFC